MCRAHPVLTVVLWLFNVIITYGTVANRIMTPSKFNISGLFQTGKSIYQNLLGVMSLKFPLRVRRLPLLGTREDHCIMAIHITTTPGQERNLGRLIQKLLSRLDICCVELRFYIPVNNISVMSRLCLQICGTSVRPEINNTVELQ